MSLFSEYKMEREGKFVIESENSFAVYSFPDGESVYIEDIYVKPELRKSGLGSCAANMIAKIAKEKGCKKMYGSIVPSANGANDSLKALLAYGFKLSSSEHNIIFFVKEI
jgi:predicted GNAT family acetyltransferase